MCPDFLFFLFMKISMINYLTHDRLRNILQHARNTSHLRTDRASMGMICIPIVYIGMICIPIVYVGVICIGICIPIVYVGVICIGMIYIPIVHVGMLCIHMPM